MLNQDPINIKGDYQVRVYAEREIAIAENQSYANETELNQQILNNSHIDERYSLLQTTIQRNGIYIAMGSTLFGLFAGIPLLIWFWSTTVINIGGVFLMFFVCGALGLIQWKYVREYLDMEYHQFSMYAFSGFGMCLINIIFCVNTFVPINNSSNTYDIISFANGNQGLEVPLSGEGNTSSLERNVATYLEEHYEKYYAAKKVIVTKSTGLFGMDRLYDCQLIY
jgi:hypothetical protein